MAVKQSSLVELANKIFCIVVNKDMPEMATVLTYSLLKTEI